MTKASSKNPLLEPQREKAGAEKFSKYNYQYHWALYRILQEHSEHKEYAVFVEYHEDVVIANSLDSSIARYEFNQIKTIDRVYSINELTKIKKKASNDSEKSVLGKLLDSCTKKSYSSLIDQINLVSLKGFNLTQKIPELRLEVIRIDDIDDKDIKSIEEKLKEQLICEKLPVTLRFVIPEIPEVGFQKFVIGEVASMLHRLFPLERYNAYAIYTLLYDELMRKGMNTNDYTEWNELLTKKALTSVTVNTVINQFSSPMSEINFEKKFEEIADEMQYKFMQKNRLKQFFNRYRQSKIGNKNTLQLETTQKIVSLIKVKSAECDDDVKTLINLVRQELPVRISEQFASPDHVISAIMCEYTMMDDYE